MASGIEGTSLAYHSDKLGAVPYIRKVTCVAGTSSYSINPEGFSRSARVIGMWGIMTGNGAAADTVQLTDGADNAITEAIDLSALSANDLFSAATVNATNRTITVNQYLKVATASDATCEVYVWLLPHEETV